MDNKRALNGIPKLWITLLSVLVGEHSALAEKPEAASPGGACRKANVGISNDKAGEKPAHRKTKVS
jgi:hypothetical protein